MSPKGKALLKKIITTGQPYHLAKYLQVNHTRNTRAASNETVLSTFKPKNLKSSRSFLVRSLRSYNLLPIELRKLSGKKFDKAVKSYYYEKENQEVISCALS